MKCARCKKEIKTFVRENGEEICRECAGIDPIPELKDFKYTPTKTPKPQREAYKLPEN